MFNRKYIFKGSIFHCYVSLPEGILLYSTHETKISKMHIAISRIDEPSRTLCCDFSFARLYFWSHPTTWHHMVIGVETSQDSVCKSISMNGKVVFQHFFHIFPISIPVCWFSLSQIRTEMKVPGKNLPKFPHQKRNSLEKKSPNFNV